MLYAISDLHLSLSGDKPMSVFGDRWKNHAHKLKTNWERTVRPDDTVLVAGDISWAMRIGEAAVDLDFLDALPGKKICMPGNHDYWWGSTDRVKKLYPDMVFLKYNCCEYKNYTICAARGWLSPGDSHFDVNTDTKIYNRELTRFETALDSAVKYGSENIILSMHFPPAGERFKHAGFFNIIKRYPVKKIIFGHLHGVHPGAYDNVSIKHIECMLVSCDYLNFTPAAVL